MSQNKYFLQVMHLRYLVVAEESNSPVNSTYVPGSLEKSISLFKNIFEMHSGKCCHSIVKSVGRFQEAGEDHGQVEAEAKTTNLQSPSTHWPVSLSCRVSASTKDIRPMYAHTSVYFVLLKGRIIDLTTFKECELNDSWD